MNMQAVTSNDEWWIAVGDKCVPIGPHWRCLVTSVIDNIFFESSHEYNKYKVANPDDVDSLE